MSKNGSIILIEDDPDDQEMIMRAIKLLGIPNELKLFRDGEEGLQYLKTMTEQPFIIISDVNMPGMDGISFKRAIDNDPILQSKSIPFVFFSTAANTEQVKRAYEFKVQGFFFKGNDFGTMKETLKAILAYWEKARHPNN